MEAQRVILQTIRYLALVFKIEVSYFHSNMTSDLHNELLRYAAVNILRFLSVSIRQAKRYISKTVDFIVNEREVTDKRREMMRYLCS